MYRNIKVPRWLFVLGPSHQNHFHYYWLYSFYGLQRLYAPVPLTYCLFTHSPFLRNIGQWMGKLGNQENTNTPTSEKGKGLDRATANLSGVRNPHTHWRPSERDRRCHDWPVVADALFQQTQMVQTKWVPQTGLHKMGSTNKGGNSGHDDGNTWSTQSEGEDHRTNPGTTKLTNAEDF